MSLVVGATRAAYRKGLIEEAREALSRGGPLAALRRPLCPVLAAVYGDPSSVSAVWHPLGCLYIELLRDGPTSVRLHVWGARGGRFSGSGLAVHAHDFQLRSYVLSGAIENRVYTRSIGVATHGLYEIEYEGRVNLLRASGRLVRCEVGACRQMRAGDIYDTAAGQFHSVRWLEPAPVATFVVARRQPGAVNLVLGPIDGRRTYRTERNPCTLDELRTAVGDVLDCLGG